MADIGKFRLEATGRARQNRQFIQSLARENDRALDGWFHEAHDTVFSKTDCLACANCCKTTSPIFYPTDIDRLSRALRMRPGDFIEKYLKVDEDRDYVLQSSPCPFLGEDNLCSVYDSRPKACREYPHTDRKKMSQILELTYKNTMVCPAVLEILEKVRVAAGLK